MASILSRLLESSQVSVMSECFKSIFSICLFIDVLDMHSHASTLYHGSPSPRPHMDDLGRVDEGLAFVAECIFLDLVEHFSKDTDPPGARFWKSDLKDGPLEWHEVCLEAALVQVHRVLQS